MSQKFILNVILKALTLFVILNLVLGFVAGTESKNYPFTIHFSMAGSASHSARIQRSRTA